MAIPTSKICLSPLHQDSIAKICPSPPCQDPNFKNFWRHFQLQRFAHVPSDKIRFLKFAQVPGAKFQTSKILWRQLQLQKFAEVHRTRIQASNVWKRLWSLNPGTKDLDSFLELKFPSKIFEVWILIRWTWANFRNRISALGTWANFWSWNCVQKVFEVWILGRGTWANFCNRTPPWDLGKGCYCCKKYTLQTRSSIQ